ncbi:MAG: hypothetical protein ACI4S2_13895 [Lachnospiraceae bacterium]
MHYFWLGFIWRKGGQNDYSNRSKESRMTVRRELDNNGIVYNDVTVHVDMLN